MLSRSAIHAIRALLELAEAPQRWRSVHDLAEAQQLPEPLLEQLMLRLRRAGLLEARRGRQGGYRLARPAAAIPLAAILAAVAASSLGSGVAAANDLTVASTNRRCGPSDLGTADFGFAEQGIGDGATAAVANHGDASTTAPPPAGASDRDASPSGERPSAATPRGASPDAAAQVTAALERRLQQALERELARFTLEELHHDLRSARAALSEDGGLLLG